MRSFFESFRSKFLTKEPTCLKLQEVLQYVIPNCICLEEVLRISGRTVDNFALRKEGYR